MNMKVLLVDDEPFILQGLSVLIDWQAEGFDIVKMASNGKEALDYLRENPVDLIIADITMPVMTGLELLQTIREEEVSDAFFVILSGYNDFKYAQKAIRYSCMDYMVKPVQKAGLLEVLRTVARQKAVTLKQEDENRKIEKLYLMQNVNALLTGKYENADLKYVKENMDLSGKLRYVHIGLDNLSQLEDLSDEELKLRKEKLVHNVKRFLGEDKAHLICEMPGYEDEHEIGLLLSEHMTKEREMSMVGFMEKLYEAASGDISENVVLLVGKEVEDIARISNSYSSACMLKPFKGFKAEKNIYYYEEEVHVNQNKVVLCKQSLDSLVSAVEQNDRVEINNSVDELFNEMESMGMTGEIVSMNTNYLLFQLIHLAVEQDESVDQEEVMLYISDNVFDSGISRGSRAHMRRFACEYAEYLIQLRKNVSRGVLLEVEKEVKEHFAENLTLKGLSKKYFVNSSYLGQIFRKKYGQSFKDYLSNYRINEAAQLLLRTDKKISVIAEEVGYHDTDYFITRFIEQKGCTPAKYRKNAGEIEGAEKDA